MEGELCRLTVGWCHLDGALADEPFGDGASPNGPKFGQIDRALVSELSIAQSLLVVWPQFVALLASTSVLFALAFVSFIRHEVRA